MRSASTRAYRRADADRRESDLRKISIAVTTSTRGTRLRRSARATASCDANPDTSIAVPTERQAFRFWLKLGMISFGGPAGQIAIMHDELVEKRRWISERRFLHALNICVALPGPEAQQLASYIGYSMDGVRGALTAGGLFVLPSFVLLCLMSAIYVEYGEVDAVAGSCADSVPQS